MSLEARRRALASFWGLFSLLCCLRVLASFVQQVGDEVDELTWPELEVLRARVGWLRPSLLRSPFLDGYVIVFLGLGAAICVGLWATGLHRWWREHRASRQSP